MISRSVLPRPPRQRARAPCLENKNSAPQARFRSQTPSKQAKVHAFWLPKQQCNQPQPPQPPHWSTRPTGPVDHPADPPTHRAPHPHPTLALGLRTLGAPGPPPGPCFPVFVFSRPPACCDPPGRPLNERSTPHRPMYGLPPPVWNRRLHIFIRYMYTPAWVPAPSQVGGPLSADQARG